MRRAGKAALPPDTYADGRCDVLAVARECVEARGPVLAALGIDAGIELPCGALPWLRLDEGRLRRLLVEALDGVIRRTGTRGVQLALWREAAANGPFRLHVEAYADDPGASESFELDLLGGEVAEADLPLGHARALLVEDHPSRRRILQAQFARLGMVSEAADPAAAISGASIAGRYGLVWLGGAGAIDRVALVTSLRLLERRRGLAHAHVAGVRDAPTAMLAGIDSWVEWPPSLEQLHALCADAPPDEDLAGALFYRESRRDTAAIRAALRKGDWDAVERHAHRIKGGTVVFGESSICAQAERIEEEARRATPDPVVLRRLLSTLERSLRRAFA